VLAAMLLAAGGAAPADKPGLLKKSDPPLKTSETVGDLGKVNPSAEIVVEGVGLVIGLNHTGSDPEPGAYRQKLLDAMRKARVPDAEKWLESDTTSLVIVRGRIPAGIGTEDTFDIEVALTPASTTTSLAGGILIMTELRQVGFTDKGQSLDGDILATCSGPIVTGSAQAPANQKIGRVLGGAKVKKAVPYRLVIKENRRSAKTAALLEAVINRRFYRLSGREQEKMATAKSDAFLVLKVPHAYHFNQFRYFQIVENLPVVDAVVNNPALQAERLDRWTRELRDPKTAGAAAIRLEGVGKNAIPTLRNGLTAPHLQCRFFAAEALAYLGDEAGVGVLAGAAANTPSFRPHALAALAALDQPSSYIKLRELMSVADVQVRYGAFDALRKLDPSDPFLGRVRVLDEEPEPLAEEGEELALQIAAPPRHQSRRTDPFQLYVVDCEGPPLVHVTGSNRCEIVIFGSGQPFLTPAVLGSGSLLINAPQGDPLVHLSRVSGSEDDDRRIECKPELAHVIRAAANLGATYPEILDLLAAAEKQKNLNGPVRSDALPITNGNYAAAQLAGVDATTKKDDAVQRAGGSEAGDQAKSKRRGPIGRFLDSRKSRNEANKADSPTTSKDTPKKTP
jgi:hypothetical protein